MKQENTMNYILNLTRTSSSSKPWPKKKTNATPRSTLSLFIIFPLSFIFLFLISYYYFTKSSFPISPTLTLSSHPQCTSQIQTLGHKFLFYAPHSGFSNQLSEFKNAILMAAILNRTLIVPPVLDHHAVVLGSCPKFRVSEPKDIRLAVWHHAIELMRTGRYVSMADIIDVSSLSSSSMIQTIDLRVFASVFCNVDIESACSSQSSALSSLLDSLEQCGLFLSGHGGNVGKCLYAVNEDCRTTVWTYQDDDSGMLDPFQPDDLLKKKKKISYIRRRHDVYAKLGPGSEADSATVLAFGSLFTSPYKGSQLLIDIQKAPRSQKIQSLIERVGYLPFVPQIGKAGKQYALNTIKAPFLCAQLRLLDGQFKNHWKTTFLSLKQNVELLKQKGPLPLHIFIMTDLPEANWTGNYLGDLLQDISSFKLHFLREENDLVTQTANELSVLGHRLMSGFIPHGFKRMGTLKKQCSPRKLSDVLLFIEETACSCASLGFVGTAGSTIAENIELMRKNNACSG